VGGPGVCAERALAVHLAEYGELKAEQRARIDRRDYLLYAHIIAIAGALAALSANPKVLLVLPVASLVLGWTHLTYDRLITAIGDYVDSYLATEIGALTGRRGFVWEAEHAVDRGRARRKGIQAVVDVVSFAGAALASLVCFCAAGHPGLPELVLAGVETAAAGVLVVQQLLTARAAMWPHRRLQSFEG
jgi:hypothetical protein